VKKSIIITGMIILLTNSSFIQAKVFATVTGTVKSEDGTPLAGAQVILIFSQDGTKFELVTDEKGRWKKVSLQPGKWTIGFLAEGFEPENLTVELSAIKTNPSLDVRLTPIPQSPLTQGDAFYAAGKYEDALQEYQRILEEHTDRAELFDKIGLCYYKLNDYDNAIVYFKKMLEKEPRQQDTLINLSAIYFERGELDEGMKYFRLLDEKTLTDSSLFYNIGVLLFKSGQIDMAIEYLSKSIKLDPKKVDAHYQLGLANLNKGDMEKARESFERVIAIAPDSEKATLARNLLEHIK
jgi:tetratricopeptide (TPR) repeat protein